MSRGASDVRSYIFRFSRSKPKPERGAIEPQQRPNRIQQRTLAASNEPAATLRGEPWNWQH
jgi:hypothetical protein